MAQSTEDANAKFLQELEVQMYAEMYSKLVSSCTKKCISTKYRDPDLTKGEAVCIDRCVAKYLDVHYKLGQKIAEITMREEAAMQKMQAGLMKQQQSPK